LPENMIGQPDYQNKDIYQIEKHAGVVFYSMEGYI